MAKTFLTSPNAGRDSTLHKSKRRGKGGAENVIRSRVIVDHVTYLPILGSLHAKSHNSLVRECSSGKS